VRRIISQNAVHIYQDYRRWLCKVCDGNKAEVQPMPDAGFVCPSYASAGRLHEKFIRFSLGSDMQNEKTLYLRASLAISRRCPQIAAILYLLPLRAGPELAQRSSTRLKKGKRLMKSKLMFVVPLIAAGFLAAGPALAQEKAPDAAAAAPGLDGVKLNPKHGLCPFKEMQASEITAFADERIALLKKELAITDAQGGPWGNYAKALKHNLESLQGMREELKLQKGPKSAPDRFELRMAALEARVASIKELRPTLNALYTALTDEQKKKADRILVPLSCIR
jgi:hypothetical protein